jgi:hypothetical protein
LKGGIQIKENVKNLLKGGMTLRTLFSGQARIKTLGMPGPV